MDYRRTVFPNGLRLLTAEMPHTRSASVMFLFGVGSRYESDAEAGLSHFIEHMTFKGTEKRPHAQDISATIEGVGGLLNAGTNQESTIYWAKVAQPHLSLALDLLTDMILHSRFAMEDIEKERQVILEEINITYDNPADLVSLLIDQILWPDHPLGRDVAGRKETVASFQRQDVLDYFSRHYAPDALVISVAGKIEHQAVIEEIHRLLGDWQGAAQSTYEAVSSDQREPRAKVHYKDIEQANLCIGLPSFPIDHPDRYVQALLNTILGEGMSSRLFLEIREKRALAYDVHSYINRFRDSGSTIIYAGVDPKRTADAIKAILAELCRLKEVPVSGEELNKAKEFAKGRLLLSMEDSRAVASWLGTQELFVGRILTVDEVIAKIDAVTTADIQRVAKELFCQEKLNLAVVGPFKKEEPFSKLLHL